MRKINQQKMFEDIERWHQSGLSQKAWCEQIKVAYSSFNYWYRLFRNQPIRNGVHALGSRTERLGPRLKMGPEALPVKD